MKTIISIVVLILVVVAGFFALSSVGGTSLPEVGADGNINGDYSIKSIMALGDPYKCTFEKSDQVSRIKGVIHTDSQDIYGEFRIMTDNPEIGEFSDFLLVKGGEAYTWTSLGNMGYISKPAASASINASPEEQAQIIGANDKVHYKCMPWQQPDPTVFEVPSFIQFVNL